VSKEEKAGEKLRIEGEKNRGEGKKKNWEVGGGGVGGDSYIGGSTFANPCRGYLERRRSSAGKARAETKRKEKRKNQLRA